jgi:hypothetical protein
MVGRRFPKAKVAGSSPVVGTTLASIGWIQSFLSNSPSRLLLLNKMQLVEMLPPERLLAPEITEGVGFNKVYAEI